MKFIFNKNFLLVLILAGGLSCRKDKGALSTGPAPVIPPDDYSTSSASEYIFAEGTFSDLMIMGEQASSGVLTSYRFSPEFSLLSSCAVITQANSASSDMDTLQIDFGAFNCLCADGRYRRGLVRILYTGGMQYRDSGNVLHFSFSSYFVNNNRVSGSLNVTNRGHVGGQLTRDLGGNGNIILANSADSMNWTITETDAFLAGETAYNGPINWSLAKLSTNGSGSGTAADGLHFTMAIATPLLRDMSCGSNRRYFVQGILHYSPSGKLVRSIDAGNGTCDDIAVVTIGSNSYTIHLP